MENGSVFEIYMSDWWISLYIQNVIGMDIHAFAVAAVFLVIGFRKLWRNAQAAAKLKEPKPLLGVVRSKDLKDPWDDEDGKH